MRRILITVCLLIPAIALAFLPAFAFAQAAPPKQWPVAGETRRARGTPTGAGDAQRAGLQ